MGRAFSSLFCAGTRGVTVEFKINFLVPAFPGDVLEACAKEVSRGKSLCYLECEIRKGRILVAKAASTGKKMRLIPEERR